MSPFFVIIQIDPATVTSLDVSKYLGMSNIILGVHTIFRNFPTHSPIFLLKQLDSPPYHYTTVHYTIKGLWYQMYADKIVISTFEKDSYCCTALYGVGPDNSITVHNYAKIGNPVNGTNYVINGFATQDNLPTYPGQLKVKFTDGGAPFPAPYWILALGPVNQNNLYDWAIVSDNLSGNVMSSYIKNIGNIENIYCKTHVKMTLQRKHHSLFHHSNLPPSLPPSPLSHPINSFLICPRQRCQDLPGEIREPSAGPIRFPWIQWIH